MSAQESMEHAEHAEHASSENRKIALLIAVIALCLALSETLGKGAQTESIAKNVEASNLWAFFQAKSIRRTTVQTAAEQAKLAGPGDDATKAAVQKQIEDWQKTAARYRSEPETGEGTEQLAERAKHAEHASSENRKIALLIAVIALFLALSETLGKGAQTESIAKNVEASNLWAFFQAKSIRRTVVQTAADQGKIGLGAGDASTKAALQKQIDDWQKTAARYRSEPETGEGTEQLSERAKHAEEERDLATAKYHHFELASGAFQISIVLASATIITGIVALAWISGVLTLAGIVFTVLGMFAPHVLHLAL